MAGPSGLRENLTLLLSPPAELETKTKYLPCTAAELMLNVAVSDVSLWTATFVALTPPVLIFNVVPEPETKFVPVIVTLTFVPLNPLDGVIEVIVGVGRPTLNFTA